MARKDAILSMRQILIMRRDALRTALAGDLSLLKELRAQTAGDMVANLAAAEGEQPGGPAPDPGRGTFPYSNWGPGMALAGVLRSLLD